MCRKLYEREHNYYTMSNPITKYFVTTKKTGEIPENNCSKSIAEQFYKNCLIQKEGTSCNQSEMKLNIKLEIKTLEEKQKKYEKNIEKVMNIICEKNTEIENLNELISQVSVKQSIKQSSNSNENVKLSFFEFENIFTSEQLACLRSIDSSVRNDSKFINTVVKMLYGDDLHRIEQITLHGCKRRGPAKAPMSPRKTEILQSMFETRLSYIDIDSQEQQKRSANLYKLINNSLDNVKKSIKLKKIEKEVCKRLEFESK